MPPLSSPADRPPLTRRHVLARAAGLVGVAGLTATMGACGLRLEEDAPNVPLLPRQTYSGGAALVDALQGAQDLRAAAAASLRGGTDTTHARLNEALVAGADQQMTALRRRLTDVGVAVPGTSPSSGAPTVGGPTSGAVTRPAGPVAAALSPARLDASRDLLASVPAADLVLVAGVQAAHLSAATLAGVQLTPVTRAALPVPVAAGLVEAASAALYGLEVAATRTLPARAALSSSSRAQLTRIRDEVLRLAGESEPTPRLGYALPFPVRTPADADRLAAHVYSGLAATLVAATARCAGSGPALATLVSWASDAEAARARWGATWRGLAVPVDSE